MAITQENKILKVKTPLADDFLLIKRMRAKEGLSQLFNIELELLHEETESGFEPTVVDPQKVIGQPMTVTARQNDGAERHFNGICVRFTQGNRDERFSKYRATLVPRVWLLTQISQSRIFQNMSVPDILRKVLTGLEVDYEIQGTFHPRNYCVQYRETDFNFISRLMEEEGIYYYFEHTQNAHRMIIANTPQSHRDCPSKNKLPFILDVSELAEEWMGSITAWRVDHQLKTGKFTLWDHCFELPKSNLSAEQLSRFNIGGNQELEFYDYPGEYAKRFDGVDKGGGEQPAETQKIFEDRTRTVEIRQQEIDVAYKNITGVSNSCSLIAGYRFELNKHPNKDNNIPHILVAVQHDAVQSPAYISGEENVNPYIVNFVCIPHGSGRAPFRPLRKTPKPVIRGSQTAYVVGPPGEEIFTDKYGRVKVQFHWDRDETNANTSCWIRVAQTWAGKNWGSMFIPRIGQEVVVDFLEGDPDRPIVVGTVYNAEAMPPYKLPDEKTKSGIKTDSTVGGGGFNELRFEDKKGSEQIFIHGEKDIDIRIKNDRREWVGNDHHYIVKRDRREKIERDEHRLIERDQVEHIKRDVHLKIDGKEAVEIGGTLSLKIGGDIAEKVSGNISSQAGGNITLKGTNVVIEATGGLTIKCGGSFVTVNPGGVQISGPMVLINSGGAALAGAPPVIVQPMKVQIADPADDAKPGSKIQLEKRSLARKEKTFKPLGAGAGGAGGGADDESKKKTHWIKIKLVDEAGSPVPGEYYKITLPDGSVYSGTLDEKGEAEVKGIDPGNCKVTFPNLDKDAWEES